MGKIQERAVKGYLPPLYARLTKGMAEHSGQSVSSIIADAVREKFDKMPVQERERILSIAKKD